MGDDEKGEDKYLQELRKRQLARQLFDPPVEVRVKVAGRPLLSIPDSDLKYPSFIDWWMQVGRKLNPNDDHGWHTLSGPGVMWNRSELIPAEDWNGLEQDERDRITAWVRSWPIGMFYD